MKNAQLISNADSNLITNAQRNHCYTKEIVINISSIIISYQCFYNANAVNLDKYEHLNISCNSPFSSLALVWFRFLSVVSKATYLLSN